MLLQSKTTRISQYEKSPLIFWDLATLVLQSGTDSSIVNEHYRAQSVLIYERYLCFDSNFIGSSQSKNGIES